MIGCGFGPGGKFLGRRLASTYFIINAKIGTITRKAEIVKIEINFTEPMVTGDKEVFRLPKLDGV